MRSSENSDAGMAGVAVSVVFTDASGTIYNLTGTTDSNGIFRSSWIKGLGGGTHRAEVVDLALTDFVWDPFDILDSTLNDEDWDSDGKPDESLVIS